MKCILPLSTILCLATAFGSVTSFNVCPHSLLGENVSGSSADYLSYRLPKEVIPIKYTLYLDNDMRNFTYFGSVSIYLKVVETTDTVVVHSDGLRILEEEVDLYRVNELQIPYIREPIVCQVYDPERQFHVLKTGKKLEPNEYLLSIKFWGEIRDDVFGFYRSFYVENGEKKWMAVTQFSPTYARRAFPCMDEPHLKAVFQLTIRSSDYDLTVTSNTKLAYRTQWNEYGFEETPRMSTYLLGWAVHEFVSDQGINSSGMFQIWTRRSMNHRGSIALVEGQSIFSLLHDWIVTSNPISKMDQIAVPDFNFHAMENWGMITYRESVVLYESGLTPTKYMIDGFTTMAHEFAHTWFGNLVTPMFWDVAWLKEGFASYFQYFAVSMVHPTWRMMDKFVVDTLQSAMLLDSEDHDRVMNGRNVGSPSSIMAVLDFVSYKKGASVIRMLSHVIGESAFQAGLQNYVTYMSYQAATPSDLYKHLQNSINRSSEIQSNVSIKEFMETWTNQPGYPLVTVMRNYETQTLTVFQERFRWDQDQSVSGWWWVPLSFTTQGLGNFSNASPSYWLRPEDKGLTLPSRVPSGDWVIFNLQHAGYYRVNYDQENWLMLTNYLNSEHFQKIHRANRAALVDDAFNLARAGYVDYSIPLDLSRYLVQEPEYEPWVAAVNNIRFLNAMLGSDLKAQRAFQEYADRLLRNMYEQLNFTESRNEEITTKLHRELILSSSCLIRSADCLNISKTLFKTWMTQPDITIPRDVKSFVYCEGIRDGDEEDWYRMLAKFQNADLQTEQELLLQGLGCTRDPSLMKRYLELAISDEQNVRKQQRMMIVNAILDGNTENLDHVLEFVQSNLTSIVELRGHDFLGKVATAIGKSVTTEEQSRKLRTLVEKHAEELGPALAAAEQALSVALGTVKWINKYVPSIANYFEQHVTLSPA